MCENKIVVKLCVAPKLIYTDWFPSMLQLLDVNKYFIRNYPQRDLWKHRKEQYLFTTLKKYSFSNFMPAVKKLSANNFFVELSGEDYCSIVRLNKHCIISFLVPYETYIKNENFILSNIEKSFQMHASYTAYICHYGEFLMNYSDISPKFYRHIQQTKYNAESLTENILKKHFFNEDIWFPACWQMWYNTNYFPSLNHKLSLLDNIKYSATHDYTKVTLYTDIFNYNAASILQLKSHFNQHIYNHEPQPEPSVHMQHQGSTLIITHYKDATGQPVSPSLATQYKIFEYSLLNDTEAYLSDHKRINITR
ncbi:MAG: hypothetical protein IKU46_06820 [Peptococcaceae bacterium]|nr:hypothetical protein [Peptococcaceae bacterium]